MNVTNFSLKGKNSEQYVKPL